MLRPALVVFLACTPAYLAASSQIQSDSARILALARAGQAGRAIEGYQQLTDSPEKSAIGVDLGPLVNRFDLALDAYRAQSQRLGRDDLDLLRRFASNVLGPSSQSTDVQVWTRACGAIAALGPDDRAAACRDRLRRLAENATAGWEARGLGIYTALDHRVSVSPTARAAFEAQAPALHRLGVAIRLRHLPIEDRAALAASVAQGTDATLALSAALVLAETCSSQAISALRTLHGSSKGDLRSIGMLGLAACGELSSLGQLRPLADRLTEWDRLRMTAGDVRMGQPEALQQFEDMAVGSPSPQRSFVLTVLAQAAPGRARDAAERLLRPPTGADLRATLDDTADLAPLLGPRSEVIEALAAADPATRTAAALWLARAVSR